MSTALPPEPALRDLVCDLWRMRIALGVGAFIGLFAGLVFLHLAVVQYRVSMLVAPTTRTGAPDVSALFPGNASFAMEYIVKSFSSGDSSDFMRFEHIVRGPAVAARLMDDPIIVAGVAQDQRFGFMPSKQPVSALHLSAYLERAVKIEPVGTTPMRRLVYDHPDVDFAAYLLHGLYYTADTLLQQEVRARAEARVEWLKAALDQATQPDHRRTLVSLLMDQEQIGMILSLDEPFAARIAEAPAGAVKPQWPKPALVLPVFVMCGLMLGFAVSAIRQTRF